MAGTIFFLFLGGGELSLPSARSDPSSGPSRVWAACVVGSGKRACYGSTCASPQRPRKPSRQVRLIYVANLEVA
ncbi:hypothetical protein L209DRAFT_757562 [Thermothelomyces heterothallicus CBS 203.75]